MLFLCALIIKKRKSKPIGGGHTLEMSMGIQRDPKNRNDRVKSVRSNQSRVGSTPTAEAIGGRHPDSYRELCCARLLNESTER